MNKKQLLVELQSQGVQLVQLDIGAAGRKGGAGPSDHKAIAIDGTTIMVPVYNDAATLSPYQISDGQVECQGQTVSEIHFPQQPQFYNLKTAEGIPYKHIALLHGRDVLATTVLQTCLRYNNRETACQFCSIGQSLAAGRTIARKTPAQLAEVAEAAVRLDGVKQMVMTTGTPNIYDRGAAYLTECAKAIKAKVNIPIQAQCEPPDDFVWFERLREAGVDTLGMHLEAVTPAVRARIMPGKAEVSLETYFEAFAAAVKVFGWGQVSTYLLAGLGDSLTALVEMSDRLIQTGVYPFVVPFVPITGTPLEKTAPPDSEFMYRLYEQVGQLLKTAGMSSQNMQSGCAKCGACSALSSFE
ncbi:MAG: MSMEG_0568 family radical SAM protein [Cyanobacteria bacterium P01_G01_bin.54]